MQNSCLKTSAWWSCGSHCVENGYLSLRFPNMVKVDIQEYWMRVTRFNPLWVSVQTSSMNEHKNFSYRLNEKACGWNNNLWKVTKSATASNACLCLDRLAISAHSTCNLWLITTENVDVKCAVFKLVNMCSGKNCLRLDLFTVKTFCCVVVEVPTWFSSDRSDVPGSRFRIADISHRRFRDAEW